MSDSNDSDVQIVRETSAADCQKGLRDELKLVSRVATTLRLQVQDVALECQAAVEDRLAAQRGTALSQQQQSAVQSQWGICEARPKDILTARHKVEVSGADFSTLQSDRWLKDSVVNAYLARVHADVAKKQPVPPFLFTTFFLTRLMDPKPPPIRSTLATLLTRLHYGNVQSWTRKHQPLRERDVIVVPVHENKVHWCLLLVLIPQRRILYLDSMVGHKKYYSRQRAEHLVRVLFAWLLLDAHDKGCAQRLFGPQVTAGTKARPHPAVRKGPGGAAPHSGGMASLLRGVRDCWHALVAALRRVLGLAGPQQTDAGLTSEDLQRSGWQGVIVTNTPRQRDESSCGVFMTAFAELALRGWLPPYHFGQADVESMRLAMAARILDIAPMDTISFGRDTQAADAGT